MDTGLLPEISEVIILASAHTIKDNENKTLTSHFKGCIYSLPMISQWRDSSAMPTSYYADT